ncbi:MAG: cyclic pyranopterin monophosphate synthase MoaC [Tepidisphaeraceae bacterium]
MKRKTLSHVDASGAARMVDVGHKPVTARQAVAEGVVRVQLATLRAIVRGDVPKGEVLSTARIAGIQAAKRCAELIPLCHPLSLESVAVDFKIEKSQIRVTATARITAKTGVEMEALTAVAVAALTIYDMCKAIDKKMRIEGIRLLSKSK